MAKDKSKAFGYAAHITANGKSHTLYFRKERQRAEFVQRASYLEGVSNASIDVGIYIYDDVDAAINTVANYASRAVKV